MLWVGMLAGNRSNPQCWDLGSQKLIRFCRLCSQPIHPPTYLRWHQSTIMATHSVTWALEQPTSQLTKVAEVRGQQVGWTRAVEYYPPTHTNPTYFTWLAMLTGECYPLWVPHSAPQVHISKVGWLTCEWVDSQMGECHKSRLELVASGKSPNLNK